MSARGSEKRFPYRTKRKSAQDEYFMHALMEHTSDNIYFKDQKSRFIKINKFMTNWLGLKNPEQAIGKTDFDFFSDEHATQAFNDEQKIIKTGESLIGVEEKETWPNGRETWVSTTKVPLLDDKKNIIGTFGISRDITEHKLAEQALQKAKQDLNRKANALKKSNKDLENSNLALEQFAYVASHDLQEPLRMVSTYAALLERKLQGMLDTDSSELFSFVIDGAKRMQILIADLLEFSRLTTLKKPFKEIDLNSLIESVLFNLKLIIQDSHAEITHGKLPVVTGDHLQLERLFQNLISNAIKYTEKNPVVHLSARKRNSFWEISVKDNGIGINQKYFDQIFGIFKRLHHRDEYSGTGIGLAICKKIVENHNGEIWLESEPGNGSTFYFSIPCDSNSQ